MTPPTATTDPTPARPAAPPGAAPAPARPWPARHGSDVRNLGLVLAGWLLLLLLIPPAHEFPVIDDYIYAGSVREFQRSGLFVMPPMSQANLVGLTVWGTLWASLFGFSLTTLTYATLFLAGVALVAFYGLARAVGVGPGGALFGTALLGANPLFVHLSYSFMTDVPFLALLFVACYGYVRGVRGEGWGWLVLGGAAAGGEFLIRQHGALIPPAFGLYLLADGLLTRRWQWRRLALTALVPGLILGGWYLWAHDMPPSSAQMQAGGRATNFVLKEPWLRVFLLRAFAVLPLTALLAWGFVYLPRARWRLLGAWAVVFAGGIYVVDRPDETWLAVSAPPFTARFGPLTYDLPQEPFSFAGLGNILQMDGLDFAEFAYPQEPIWSHEAWWALWLLGAGLAAAVTAALLDGARRAWQQRRLSPRAAVYGLGGLLFGASLALSGDLFDRYVLAFVPFILLFVARGTAHWGRRAWAGALMALLLATFTGLAKADHMEHMAVRWEAARWVEARVGAVTAGWNWAAWGHPSSDGYRVADLPAEGFRTEREFPYLSRLSGFTTRTVLAQARADLPPLPDPPPTPGP